MRRRLLHVVVMVLLSGMRTACGQVQYTITDLGTFGGTGGIAYGINNSGQVVGSATTANNYSNHAFLFDNGTMTDIGSLINGGDAHAYGINNCGQIVGAARTAVGALHAFLYSNGAMTDLGTIGSDGGFFGLFSQATAINDNGQVVGDSYTSDLADHAFRTEPNQPINPLTDDLGTLGGTNSQAVGINNAGQVVGYAYTTGNTNYHAFLYSGTSMSDLGTFGGTFSYAAAINNNGQIVGWAEDSNDITHAFLHSGSGSLNPTTDDLGTLGGTNSLACGVNSMGVVVGMSETSGNTAEDAFIYHDGIMQDLNNLIPANSGLTLEAAYGINDKGQIVGYASSSTEYYHAVLLTPVPEPSALALFGVGAICLFGPAIWRRRRAV